MEKNKLPKGFLSAGLNCGIKKKDYDLGLIFCQKPYPAIGFFTSNLNVSYSVSFCRKNIKNPVKAILVNSGNANCFSSRQGYQDTEAIAESLAKTLQISKKNILFASTGIIGKKLPKEKIIKKLKALKEKLTDSSDEFAESILTTDTKIKTISKTLSFGKKRVKITGVVKGAGMIKPNLATMLAFILTDADIDLGVLKKRTREIIGLSFNSINIDSAESTNDSLFLVSSQKVKLTKAEQKKFFVELEKITIQLAKKIVEDAEGATKFIQLDIRGAKTKKEAKKIADKMCSYILLRCAFYGDNPEPVFGRIIAALGQEKIKVKKENLKIKLTSLKKNQVYLSVELKRGEADWRVYTCDLSPEYVKINAEYS